MIILKSDKEIHYMREAGRIVASTLAELEKAVAPGVTTGELDRMAEDFIRSRGALPAFKGYRGFPRSICTSVNEEVVHGIPGKRQLRAGDILSLDVGVYANGFYGDGAVTLPVGEIDVEARRLLRVAEESLYRGIEMARPGNYLTDISHAIQSHVERHGFGVVRELVGHGIGRQMHEDPQVPNFGPPGTGPVLREGMTLAVEPMVNMGAPEVYTASDGWTVITRDGKPSAHFEHTIAITTRGAEILTARR